MPSPLIKFNKQHKKCFKLYYVDLIMKQNKILVSCGAAVATSTVIARIIEEKFEEAGLKVIVTQCKASEVPAKLDGVDLIITTTTVSDTGDIPVIQTLSFLTGADIECDIKKIISYIQE